jgi:Transposase DDE domain group 1
MNSFSRWFANGKKKIEGRLNKSKDTMTFRPMFSASNIHYDVAEKTHGISCGGIGAIHQMVQKIGLIKAIDQGLGLLKLHMPYHDSDHVLNFAYNALCGGVCLQDMELRRNDVNFLDALGTSRIPDPTTAGDYCRRFQEDDVIRLSNIINEVRLRVWKEQPASFFDCATIDLDGSIAPTTGACKEGMDISYDGQWGYHPLLVSLANTGEVLSIINRPGNRPSHEGAAREADRALYLCLRAGFRKVLLRGDTDFSQSKYLDGWDALPRVRFIFGFDAVPKLVSLAKKLPKEAWRPLKRPARYQVKTKPRRRPQNVKDRIIQEREFDVLRLQSEEVAEFSYRPVLCGKPYRMVVVRKNITKEKGQPLLFPGEEEVRYFFYITNERDWTADEIVFSANDRCNQENLIAQLKNGVRALKTPVDTLESNWAYMVMTALAWNLKAWWALLLPAPPGRWQERHRTEKEWVLKIDFRTFLNAFVLLPCQIIKTGRKLVYRLLGWNPHLSIFFRLLRKLRN